MTLSTHGCSWQLLCSALLRFSSTSHISSVLLERLSALNSSIIPPSILQTPCVCSCPTFGSFLSQSSPLVPPWTAAVKSCEYSRRGRVMVLVLLLRGKRRLARNHRRLQKQSDDFTWESFSFLRGPSMRYIWFSQRTCFGK